MTPVDLLAWRQTRHLTQTQLAVLLGVTLRAEARWERGERAIPALLPLALKGLEFQIGQQNGSATGAAADLVAAH